MSERNELKPCASCGSKAVDIADNDMGPVDIKFAIFCLSCGAKTDWLHELWGEGGVAEEWNRRA